MIIKLILICLFIVYCKAEDVTEVDNSHMIAGIKRQYNEMMDKALKRRYPGYTPNPDDNCTNACQKMPSLRDIQEIGYVDDSSNPSDRIRSMFRTKTLRKLCEIVNNTVSCIRTCPNTQRKEFLKEVFAPLKYVCEESNLVAKADCLNEAYTDVVQQCRNVTCNEKRVTLMNKLGDGLEDAPDKKAFIENTLDIGCIYVRCKLDCTEPNRISKCGSSVNEEFRTMYQKLGSSLTSIRHLVDVNNMIEIDTDIGVINIPKSCQFS